MYELGTENDPVEMDFWTNPQTNYCKQRVMYECDCGPALSQQRLCRFFDKSTQRQECMYRHFGKYCDSVAAQAAADGKSS